MAGRKRPQTKQTPAAPPQWDFFRFEVFVGIFAGIFVSATLISFELGGYAGLLHAGLLVVSLFAMSWGLSRGISRFVVSRIDRRRKQREEEEERERRALAARARAQTEAEAPAEAQVRRRRRRRS